MFACHAAVSSGDWACCGRTCSNRKSSRGINQWIASVINRPTKAHGAAASINTRSPRQSELSKEPIETEFVEVVLGDLQKLRLDFHLRGSGGDGGFHHAIDQVQIGLGVFNNEAAGAGNVIRAGALWKGNALRLQKIFGLGAGDDGLTARPSLRSASGRRLHKAWGNLVFLGD